ncbi:DUF5719 family protein [Leifsonia sp. A12D58]|uniref:DUF5719 family protein n=1 Tax=Leifsonia sp. A12D58 TaxID=3397674 RepID=UPI0039DF78BC
MPSKRGVALAGARAVAGLIGIGVAVVAVGASTLIEWPDVQAKPPSVLVSPQAAEQQRVCPGPLLTLAADSSQADAATSFGSADTVYGARSLTSESRLGPVVEPTATDLDAVDNSKSSTDGSPVLISVPVQSGEETVPLVAGSQSQNAATETLGGFAASSCVEAVADSWLVGGSTDIGNTSLVLLGNPTDVAATVDLTVYSETGVVNAPGATGILVQPGTQRIISLAGLAPNLKSPIVHVESRGGQIAASLEQSAIQGISPRGAEMIGTTSKPALVQVIAGLTVSGQTAAPEDSESALPSIRVMAPGDDVAVVQVGLISEGGAATGVSLQVQLQPGIATEVPLDSLGAGSYTAVIESDKPLVAAARTQVNGITVAASPAVPGTPPAAPAVSVAPDFAWYVSSDKLPGDFLVAVAPGPSPTLHLYNPGATDASLTVTPNAGGTGKPVSVPAGGSTVTDVAASTTYAVTGGTGIVASVSYLGNGQVSSFALRPPGVLASAIRVYGH